MELSGAAHSLPSRGCSRSGKYRRDQGILTLTLTLTPTLTLILIEVPSEKYSRHVSEVIHALLPKYMDPNVVRVMFGDRDMTQVQPPPPPLAIPLILYLP